MRFVNDNSHLGLPLPEINYGGSSSPTSSFGSHSPSRSLKPNAQIAPLMKSYSPTPAIDIPIIDEINIF